uniref:Receptor-interacting serine/threonine-protein kinase 1-like n=1 Tax=Phallusia mammillata TaxID=59560 RepID=A0A6F9DQ79_9ASCI|nr:receptor-interacting serine/threonine-protein kinase 1-like [Phallusia mammillata]
MHSTEDTDYTLLTTAFTNCKVFTLPPLHSYVSKMSGIADSFIERFCSLAWDMFVSMEVKVRYRRTTGAAEIMKVVSYYTKVINMHTVQRPTALIRDSAMEHFGLLTKYELQDFETKLKQVMKTIKISSVYEDLFESAKKDVFKMYRRFPSEFRGLNWHKTQTFQVDGTCLIWKYQYQRQFDEKIEQLKEKQRKPTLKTQKQKNIPKKVQKQADEKSKFEMFDVAKKAAINAHRESLEIGGLFLNQTQFWDVSKTSEEFALGIFSQHLTEDTRLDNSYQEQEDMFKAAIKKQATERWEKIKKLYEDWISRLERVMKSATNVYKQQMEKTTHDWVSDDTFRKLSKGAKQTAINTFTQSAYDTGADEELFDSYMKKLKSTFSAHNKEVAKIRSKIEEGLKDQFENKVIESFAVYENHMKKCSEELEKDQTYIKYILEHTEAVELAQENFATCQKELFQWKGFKVYEKRLMALITAEYEKEMMQRKSTETNIIDELYKISMASAKVYERAMQKATEVWISKKTFAEKDKAAKREGVKFFRLHAGTVCGEDVNKMDAFDEKMLDSFNFLKGHMIERNNKNEQFLEGHFEKKVEHFSTEYAKLFRKFCEAGRSERARKEGHAEISADVLKQFKESCTSEELLWEGFQPAQKSLEVAIEAENNKLLLIIKEEALDKKKMLGILIAAAEDYFCKMKEALKTNNRPFEEQHKKCVEQAKKSLKNSSFWSKAYLRLSMEEAFSEKVALERDFFLSVYEMQKNEGRQERENQVLEVYKEAMDSGIKEAVSVGDCEQRNRSSLEEASESTELNCNMENENFSFYWKKYKEIFQLQQNLKSMKMKLSEHDKLESSGIKTTLPYFPPNELPTSRNRLETGFFSFVKKAWNNLHGYVAVKYYQTQGIHKIDDELMKQIMKGMEKFYLKTHDSVVKVFGYTSWPGSLGAVMEYIDDIDYFNVASQLPAEAPYFPVLLRTRFCVDVASAFVFLQSAPQLVIGDITVDDVFVTRNARCKVGGFKFRNIINGDLDAESQRESYCGADALGLIMYALVIGKDDEEFNSDKLKLATVDYKPSECSQALTDEIESCISKCSKASSAHSRLHFFLEGAESTSLLDQHVVEFTEFLEGFRENCIPHDIGGSPFDQCL